MTRTRQGITLVETLVVSAILLILMALILPAIQYTRAAYDTTSCKSNLRQLSLALHHFHQDYGRLPPSKRFGSGSDNIHSRTSWRVQLLPYIEQNQLWLEAKTAYDITWNGSSNPPHTGFSKVVRIYTCPTDSRLTTPQIDPAGHLAGFASYLGVSGAYQKRGIFGNVIGLNFKSITDGLSNTLMLCERPPPGNFMAGYWYAPPEYPELTVPELARMYPNDEIKVAGQRIFYEYQCVQDFSFRKGTLDNPCSRGYPWSLHPTGANFSKADASVSFFPYSAYKVVEAMASRSGGETELEE